MSPSGGITFDPLHRHPLMSEWESARPPARMPNDSSDEDSIAMRRRHGEYFHRPPVWFPRPCSYATSSEASHSDEGQPEIEPVQNTQQSYAICPSCSAGLDLHCSHQFSSYHKESFDSATNWYPSASTLVDDAEGSDMGIPSKPVTCVSLCPLNIQRSVLTSSQSHEANTSQSPEQRMGNPIDIGLSRLYHITRRMPPEELIEDNFFYQRKVALCTRLQFYRDIRCPSDEQWAMQEGSLVVGIQPAYVGVIPDPYDKDEFEIRFGRFYVIARMYADLWALCVDVSFDMDNFDSQEGPASLSIGFLPLCAVTLPANLSRFLQRCRSRFSEGYEIEPLYPWNGQTVVPPKRSHSLKAMAEMFEPEYTLQLQPMAEDIFKNFSSVEGTTSDFVPLDSPLKELISKMSDGAKGLSWVRRVLLPKRRGTQIKLPRFSGDMRGILLNGRRVTQDSMSSELTSMSHRPEESCQSEGLPRTQGVCRALSHSFGRLLGISSKQDVPSETSQKHV